MPEEVSDLENTEMPSPNGEDSDELRSLFLKEEERLIS